MQCSTDPSLNTVEYRKKRYVTFGIISIISLILPFITIEGKHLFLFSFDRKQLHLLFTTFDMQELYLMPFLLILLLDDLLSHNGWGSRMVWVGMPSNNFSCCLP